MNSNFLQMIGLGGVDAGIILLVMAIVEIILLIFLVVALVNIRKFGKKYQKFMQGKNASSLEDDIMKLYADNQNIKKDVEKHKTDIAKLFEKHTYAFQKMGLVKYDAFKEMGGKLSFCLALLDENNNGVIINSVHSSGGCYSYTKRVKKGDADIALSNEEKVAVERAIKGSTAVHDQLEE